MEVKLKNEYIEIIFSKEKKYLEVRKTVLTEDQTEEDYKVDILKWHEVLEETKPIFQLVDERNMLFIVTPNLQTWINKTLIAPAISNGLRKVAILLPEELFTQVSIEQIMEENKNSLLKLMYFENEEEAKSWLFE